MRLLAVATIQAHIESPLDLGDSCAA